MNKLLPLGLAAFFAMSTASLPLLAAESTNTATVSKAAVVLPKTAEKSAQVKTTKVASVSQPKVKTVKSKHHKSKVKGKSMVKPVSGAVKA